MDRKSMALRIFTILTAVFFAAVFFIPVMVTITNSFMTAFEISNRYAREISPINIFRLIEGFSDVNFVDMTLIPAWFSIAQYAELIFDHPIFFEHFWNSAAITFPSVAGQVLIALPAAYAFEVSRWRHKEKLFFMYIVIMLMPLPVVIVPQFVMAGFVGIQESVFAVILPAVFSPFGVFLLRQFLKLMPHEYLEAAKIDGAGHIVTLGAIVVPMLRPAIASLVILAFIDYWNVVEQALVFIPNMEEMPLSVVLPMFSPDIIFAAACLYMLPALIVFLHGQEHLVEGIQLSGIK